jgi:hypothetical protein
VIEVHRAAPADKATLQPKPRGAKKTATAAAPRKDKRKTRSGR